MAFTFLRTMNIPELAAKSRSDYINIAVRLWADRVFYSTVVTKIQSNVHLIWEDVEYAYSWYQLLIKSVGGASMSWEDYVIQSGRDLTAETQKRNVCRRNRLEFDSARGAETWLLDSGLARLNSQVVINETLRAFNDWAPTTNYVNIEIAGDNLLAVGDTAGAVRNSLSPSTSTSTSIDATSKSSSSVLAVSIDNDSSQGAAHYTSVYPLPLSQSLSLPEIAPSTHAASSSAAVVAAKEEMERLAMNWQLSESYDIGLVLSKITDIPLDPMLLLNLGAIQFFRGEYLSSYTYCTLAATETPLSILVQECIGVSGMYLPGKEIAVLAALRLAWTIQQQGTDNSAPSSIINFSSESVLLNLLTALKEQGQYRECMRLICKETGMIMPEKGGATDSLPHSLTHSLTHCRGLSAAYYSYKSNTSPLRPSAFDSRRRLYHLLRSCGLVET